MNDFVIQTILPDGPHWYGGLRKKQNAGALIQGPEWTPYWEDVSRMNEVLANITFKAVCNEMPGAEVIPVVNALTRDARKWRGGDSFSIRGKYLQPNQVILFNGHKSEYVVREISDKTILCRSVSGDNMRIVDRGFEEWVTVVGRVTTSIDDLEDFVIN